MRITSEMMISNWITHVWDGRPGSGTGCQTDVVSGSSPCSGLAEVFGPELRFGVV